MLAFSHLAEREDCLPSRHDPHVVSHTFAAQQADLYCVIGILNGGLEGVVEVRG